MGVTRKIWENSRLFSTFYAWPRTGWLDLNDHRQELWRDVWNESLRKWKIDWTILQPCLWIPFIHFNSILFQIYRKEDNARYENFKMLLQWYDSRLLTFSEVLLRLTGIRRIRKNNCCISLSIFHLKFGETFNLPMNF